MTADYPAAHSMDTCFFAVDRDGHVACFDTGEAGAVPADALSGEEADELRQLLAGLPRVEVVHDLRGRITPGRRSEFREHCFHLGLPGQVLMFLTSLDTVQEEIDAGRAVQVPASEGVAVLFREMSEELNRRLHDGGACRGCFWQFHDEEMEEHQPDLAARGLFSYSHLTDNWISGPYGRADCPARPLHVDQLPPHVRDAVQAVRFDTLCFADTPHIQPVEHTDCVSWEAAYMDVTGTHIRPIPGREDEYPDAYGELRSLGENIEVEPPPGRPRDDEQE